MTRNQLLVTLSLASLTACEGNDSASGTGTVRIAISGEEASREGYPVGSGEDEIAFADGWTLEMRKVLVSFTDFELRSADGDDAAVAADAVVADLHLGEPELWTFEGVPARRWDRVGYRSAPPTEDARAANDVSDADLERMIDGGYSLLVEAVATKGDREIAIEYGFDMRSRTATASTASTTPTAWSCPPMRPWMRRSPCTSITCSSIRTRTTTPRCASTPWLPWPWTAT